MTAAPDQAERDRALDPGRSVIVQAPAGSGKTTLLVGRYLRLLGRANRPEEILAITFTRKAAAEMRERVLQALRHGAEDAAAALARDRDAGWQLALQPHRLRIQTIDSFASALVHQLPLASQFRPGMELVEDAEAVYATAVDRLFQRLYRNDPLADELTAALTLFGNDYRPLRALLVNMLARRDQWLDLVRGVVQLGRHEPEAVRELVAAGVTELTRRIVAELDDRLDAGERDDLHAGITYAADQLGVPVTEPADLYRLAGRLLTTGDGRLRRRLTRQQGFPATEPLRKAAMLDLLERLEQRGCEPLLDNLRMLPTALVDGPDTEVLTSLCITLLLAVVELDGVLLEQGRADFTQLVLSATRALSDGDAPTELALALDYRIRHLLVDEFQDTSESQFRLFSLLVQGWSPGDGNTFFAVGDPMQSVYRFRDADVRVFYEAWHRGIAGIPLEPIRLTANFRASRVLVDWCNATFSRVMGPTDDPLLGRVAYSRASAARDGGARPVVAGALPRSAASAVHHDLLAPGTDQSAAVVRRLRALRHADPAARVAVLVRSRSHLGDLLPALRRAGIPWRATDIDLLASRPVVQDLVSLAHALADPRNRLAWFSVLRSPWVGLDHPDLEAFATLPTPADGLDTPDLPPGLGADARARLERLRHALTEGRRLRHEAPPRSALEITWLLCGGADAYPGDNHLRDAERLFALMDDLGADADDPLLLARAAQRLFAEDTGPASLEIMTIHKAKGLEFDHVVLPYLDRTTRPTDPPLLPWRREGGGLLMAERRSGELYRWLAREDRARDAHERERLLYVACTRARESLHLFAEVEERPAGDSLLSLLWPQYAEAAIDAQTRHLADAPAAPYRPAARESATSPPAARLRLPADHVWCPPAMDYPPPPIGPAAVERDALAHLPEVGLGTLIHEVLHHLSRVPLPDDALAFCRARQHVWREALQRFGVPDAAHDALLARLTDQLRGVLADPDGRRILQARTGAYAELALSSAGEVGVTRAFVDRTYVDPDGRRWIVDYKTGAPMPGETEQAFVAAEMQRHGPQLQRYAALARAVFAEPLRLALYFTALPRLEIFD